MYHEGPRRALRTFCPGWVRTQAIGCVEQGDRATAVTLYRNVLTPVPCHLVPIEGQTQAAPPAPPSSWALPRPPLSAVSNAKI